MGLYSLVERFLLEHVIEPDYSILIFISDQGISNLLNSDVIGGDGTFLSAAKLLKQHWIVQAGFEDGSVYVPSRFALMTHGTEHAYVRLFSTIKKACGAQELKPKHLMVDFETATINALKKRCCTCSSATECYSISMASTSTRSSCQFHR